MTTSAGDPSELDRQPHQDATVATPPGEDTVYGGVEGHVEAGVEPDPDLAEEFAESVPLDPTPDQVEHYLELVGEDDPTPGAPS
ncbi:MAG TPA: hypothetical protein VE781_09830 [Kineosporiaceae bacterium]|jgi:hypothetical protein|nr:hypothetical protein [Kineosporiaceae bacterium]